MADSKTLTLALNFAWWQGNYGGGAELDKLLHQRQLEGTQTHFVKVRSHRADPLNEEADSVA